VLEREQDGLVLEVEVVELVDQVPEVDRSGPSGGRCGIDHCRYLGQSGRSLAVYCWFTLADTELLLCLVHVVIQISKILGIVGTDGQALMERKDNNHVTA
jgi:hypothetical protein